MFGSGLFRICEDDRDEYVKNVSVAEFGFPTAVNEGVLDHVVNSATKFFSESNLLEEVDEEGIFRDRAEVAQAYSPVPRICLNSVGVIDSRPSRT